ncbi:MFS transporter [Candidatus Gracilibacteria bacterium]|nr:MFS transporter [Candidatus Gracilibacteria bacterium]
MIGKTTFLKKYIGVSDVEAPRVKVAWITRFLFQVGFVVAWTIVTALWVENFGIGNLLWLFLADAVLYIASTFLASIVLPRVGLRSFLLGSTGITALCVLISFFFPPQSLIFFALVVLGKDLFFSQLNIALYRLHETFFSPSEAQRFMPVIESAITIGAIAGALLTISFLSFTSTQSVLFIWLLSLLSMGMIVFACPRTLHEIPVFFREREEKVSNRPLREAFHALKTTPFLKHLGIILVLQAAMFTVIEFQFTYNVQSHIVPHEEEYHAVAPQYLQASLLSDVVEQAKEVGHALSEDVQYISSRLIMHETLAHDLGMFHLIFAVIALLVQLGTPFVIRSFGIVGSVMAYFFILFVALAAFVLGYGNINLLRTIQHGAHSIGEAPYHISFYSIFSHSRESVRLFLEGLLKPIGIALGVLGLFLLSSVTVMWAVTIAAALVLLVCLLMRRSFTHLSQKNLDQSENIEGMIHSIEVLAQRGHDKPEEILSEKLRNKAEHEIVREKIITTISQIGSPRPVHTYLEILRDTSESEETKIQVLESLFRLQIQESYWEKHAFTRYHLLKTLKELFCSTNHTHIQKLVVMNLFRHLPSHEVVPFFLEQMKSMDEKIQSVFLRSCRVFNDPEIAYYIQEFLEHKNARLRSHAVIALWKFQKSKNFLRNVLKELLESEDISDQISALYAIGEVGDQMLREMVLDFADHHEKILRLHALISLAKLGDERAVCGLLEMMFEEDMELSRSAFFMMLRVPETIRLKIEKRIQMEVSRQVFKILQGQNSPTDIPSHILGRLAWLYRMAGRYDDLVAMGRYKKGV